MSDSVPKDPGDVDRTLNTVLQLIKLRNRHDRKLTAYAVMPTAVELTFQPITPPPPPAPPPAAPGP